jgi:hypothetical protein
MVLSWLGQLLTVTLHDPDLDFRGELDGLDVSCFPEDEAWLFEAGRSLLLEGRNPKDDDWETRVVERLTRWSEHPGESPISWMPFPFGGSDWSIEDDLWLNLRIMWVGPDCLRTVEQVREARRWVELIDNATNEVFTAEELPDDLLVGVGELLIESEAWDPSPPAGMQGKAAASSVVDSVLPPDAAQTNTPAAKPSLADCIVPWQHQDHVHELDLIDGWLEPGVVSMLTGPPGVGKTMCATGIARSVATLEPWLGSPVSADAGPVIYWAAEDPGSAPERFRAHEMQFGGSDAGRLFVVKPPSGRLLTLADLEWVEALHGAATRLGASLVVIDTLSVAGGLEDENGAGEVGQLMARLVGIASDTGAHVMVVHHPPKNAGGLRGSSALLGSAREVLELATDADGTRLRMTKRNNGPKPRPKSVQVIEVEGARRYRDGSTGTVGVMVIDAAQAAGRAEDDMIVLEIVRAAAADLLPAEVRLTSMLPAVSAALPGWNVSKLKRWRDRFVKIGRLDKGTREGFVSVPDGTSDLIVTSAP